MNKSYPQCWLEIRHFFLIKMCPEMPEKRCSRTWWSWRLRSCQSWRAGAVWRAAPERRVPSASGSQRFALVGRTTPYHLCRPEQCYNEKAWSFFQWIKKRFERKVLKSRIAKSIFLYFCAQKLYYVFKCFKIFLNIFLFFKKSNIGRGE